MMSLMHLGIYPFLHASDSFDPRTPPVLSRTQSMQSIESVCSVISLLELQDLVEFNPNTEVTIITYYLSQIDQCNEIIQRQRSLILDLFALQTEVTNRYQKDIASLDAEQSKASTTPDHASKSIALKESYVENIHIIENNIDNESHLLKQYEECMRYAEAMVLLATANLDKQNSTFKNHLIESTHKALKLLTPDQTHALDRIQDIFDGMENLRAHINILLDLLKLSGLHAHILDSYSSAQEKESNKRAIYVYEQFMDSTTKLLELLKKEEESELSHSEKQEAKALNYKTKGILNHLNDVRKHTTFHRLYLELCKTMEKIDTTTGDRQEKYYHLALQQYAYFKNHTSFAHLCIYSQDPNETMNKLQGFEDALNNWQAMEALPFFMDVS
ncbi:MAG: hypothetical protein Q8K36_05270 [Alphaproteobacteria bacterium]|nr:hypothetical protein [Alphaproteobacteria bacterium]